jgi:hypothetical protein
MENVKIDKNDVSNKDKSTNESTMDENIKKYQEIRKNSIVQMVQNQTDYDIDKTLERLYFWNGNYLNVIKEWLNPDFKLDKKTDNKSKNQMKWDEIRNFMDDVNKKQLLRKRQKEHMEKKKAEYIHYLKQKEKIDAETKSEQ